jgi:hypothetical protein
MSTNKENLKMLLEFISKILHQDGNEWFHDELAVLISKKIISEKDSEIKLSAVTIKEIGSIDKYIENGLIPIINYELINDKSIRYTLIRDCVEMGKFRFSHFGQNQSFLEFCKYAFFQIEQLINYYIKEVNQNSFQKSIDYIKSYNPKARIDGKKNISSIPFSDKLVAVQYQIGFSKELKGILDKVSYARNNTLHRSAEISETHISEEQFKLSISKEKSSKTSEDYEIINEYYYSKFIADRDFDLVTLSISEIKNLIIKNLENHKIN